MFEVVQERARGRVWLTGQEHRYALDPLGRALRQHLMKSAKRTSSCRAFSARIRVPRRQVSITSMRAAPTARGIQPPSTILSTLAIEEHEIDRRGTARSRGPRSPGATSSNSKHQKGHRGRDHHRAGDGDAVGRGRALNGRTTRRGQSTATSRSRELTRRMWIDGLVHRHGDRRGGVPPPRRSERPRRGARTRAHGVRLSASTTCHVGLLALGAVFLAVTGAEADTYADMGHSSGRTDPDLPGLSSCCPSLAIDYLRTGRAASAPPREAREPLLPALSRIGPSCPWWRSRRRRPSSRR